MIRSAMSHRLPISLALLLLVTGIVTAQPPTFEQRPLTDENYRHWLDFIRPRGDELAFEAIPWRTTLQDAVLEADERDRPILLWAMNGHPLSCT